MHASLGLRSYICACMLFALASPSPSVLQQRANEIQSHVDAGMLRRAVLHVGDHTLSKWRELEDVICSPGMGSMTILSLGGSISAGRVVGGLNGTFGAYLQGELQNLYPSLAVRLVSGAHTTMGSCESAMCLNFIWEEDVQVVLIDHTCNDWALYGEDNNSCLETLLRVVNSRFPNAVVILVMFWGAHTATPFRLVDPHNHLAAHYGITAISANDAFGFYKERKLAPFSTREAFVGDHTHPRKFVHKFIAQTIIWSLAKFAGAPEAVHLQPTMEAYNSQVARIQIESMRCWSGFSPAAVDRFRLPLARGWEFKILEKGDQDSLRMFTPTTAKATYDFTFEITTHNTSVIVMNCLNKYGYLLVSRHGLATTVDAFGKDVSHAPKPFHHPDYFKSNGMWAVASGLSPGAYTVVIQATSLEDCFAGFGIAALV